MDIFPQMFRRLHNMYTNVVCNPFYIPGEQITSRYDVVIFSVYHALYCLKLGSHIHNFEPRRTATFEIGASGSELRPALDH